MKASLAKLAAGESLTREEVHAALDAMLRPDSSATLTAAWLVALRMKGETPTEIAAVAESMRARAEHVEIQDREAIDTCGTGGDGAATFNISTAAAFVAAGAGVTVAKHGNRAVSSRSGSADVLEALGVTLDAPMEAVRDAIDRERIGFLFAQRHHPAMRHVAPVRKELGLRTVFNLAGPLANPARVTRQLLGVFNLSLVDPMAKTLALLGATSAWVVHGEDGLDEMSLAGETVVAEVRADRSIHRFVVVPEDAGLTRAPISALAGGDAKESAAIVRAVLNGEKGPRRDAVLLNAAAALVVAGRTANLRDGAQMAANAIDSGAALARLDGLVAATGAK